MDAEIPINIIQFILFSTGSISYFLVIVIIIPYSLIPICIFIPILLYISYKFTPIYYSSLLIQKKLKKLYNKIIYRNSVKFRFNSFL